MYRKAKVIILAVTLFLALVVGIYVANPEATQGAMKFLKIPRAGTTTESVPTVKESTPVKPAERAAQKKVETNVDKKTGSVRNTMAGISMDNVKRTFKELLDSAPDTFINDYRYGSVGGLVDKYQRMRDEFGEDRRGEVAFKTSLWEYLAKKNGWIKEGSESNKKLKEYLDLLNWQTPDGDEAPDNYVFVFPYAAEVVHIDTSKINIDDNTTWPYATSFAACAVGNEPVEIRSASFTAEGRYDFSLKFQGYYAVYNPDGSSEWKQMWPSLITTDWNFWPGDVDFSTPIVLDPTTDNYCTVFAFKYASVNPMDLASSKVFFEHFSLRGLRKEVAGDIAAYGVSGYGNWMRRVGFDPDNIYAKNPIHGSIDVFHEVKDLLAWENYYEDEYVSPGNYAWLGNFTVSVPPNSKVKIDTLTFNLESTYGDEVEFEGGFGYNYGKDLGYYNFDNDNGYGNSDITLHKGLNVVNVNKTLAYGMEYSLYFNVNEIPDVAPGGYIKLSLVGAQTDGTTYQANGDYYFEAPLLSSVNGPKVNIVPAGQPVDPILYINYWPHAPAPGTGYWPTWFNEKDTQELGGHKVFNMDVEFPSWESDGTLFAKIDNFSIDVLGNFEKPLKLNVESPVGTFTEYDVLPGYKINVNGLVLPTEITGTYSDGGTFTSYVHYLSSLISAKSISEDSDMTAKYIRFKVDNVSGIYQGNGISVQDGDSIPIFIYKNGDEADLTFPLVSKKVFFGKEFLTAWPDGNNSPFEVIDLAQYPEDQQEFSVNSIMLKAQGDIFLKSLKFKHTYQVDSPFEDIILETNNNKIYFNDAISGGNGSIVKWTDEYITFTLTNPELIHHDHTCFIRLDVLRPKENVSGMWFNLVEVEAVDKQNDGISTFTQVVPNLVLISDDPIKGTVYDFICDDIDGNGTCD